MKLFIHLSCLIAFVGMTGNATASLVDVEFSKTTHETVVYPLPHMEMAAIEQIVIENTGESVLKGLAPFSNGRDFFSHSGIAGYIVKQKNPAFALYRLWQDGVAISEEPISKSRDPLYLLNYVGACEKSQHPRYFAKLCRELGFPVRQANLHGVECYDVYLKGRWVLIDPTFSQLYLDLDNTSLASSEDVMDEPLLALRAFNNRAKGFEALSRFEIAAPSAVDIEDPILVEDAEKRGFDLYPQETISYICGSEDDKSSQRTIEQRLNLQARGEQFTYCSCFPIVAVYNDTDAPVTLISEQVTISPGQAFGLCQEGIFELEILSAPTAEGVLVISSTGNKNAFPMLTGSKDVISLGVTENPTTLRIYYSMGDMLLDDVGGSLEVIDTPEVFDQGNPVFCLQSSDADAVPEQIHWQISSDADFADVLPALDQTQEETSLVELSSMNSSLVNSEETYYFRAKGCFNGAWSDWNAPFAFIVQKPDAVKDIEFSSLENGHYQISWEGCKDCCKDCSVEYLIFGSNSFDFIPSLYDSKQINSLVNGEVLDEDSIENLVAVTTETSITIDGSLSYYRIIARENGRYSVPSPIIHVYDQGLKTRRDVLQVVEIDGDRTICERVQLPQNYEWVEPQNDPLLMWNMGVADKGIFSLPASFQRRSVSKESVPYIVSPYVSSDVWALVEPFFLPINHPSKAKVDRIFTRKRVTLTPQTFKDAGFKRTHVGRFSRVMASGHPRLPGLFIKIFTDLEKNIIDYKKWLHRIEGARSIKECIARHGYQSQFKVPKKWIYPLPPEPSPPNSSEYVRKNFILVAEDMRILSSEKNYKKYKDNMTKSLLDKIYIIFQEEGLWDSVYAFNVPFCKDGKLAFVDTEHHHKWPVPFHKLSRYFSPEMSTYWQYLIDHGGPQ